MLSGLSAVLATSLCVVAPAPAGASGCFSIHRVEKSFANKMNRTRRAIGLRSMRLDPQLTYVARRHTRKMIRHHRLFHTTQSQFDRWVTRWNYIGENVGYGGRVSTVYTAFLNSPDHYANIIGRHYSHVGVGVVRKGSRLWVTIQFEGWRNPGTRLDMPPVCR